MFSNFWEVWVQFSTKNSFKALDFLSCLKNVYQKLVATAPLFQTFCSLTYSNA